MNIRQYVRETSERAVRKRTEDMLLDFIELGNFEDIEELILTVMTRAVKDLNGTEELRKLFKWFDGSWEIDELRAYAMKALPVAIGKLPDREVLRIFIEKFDLEDEDLSDTIVIIALRTSRTPLNSQELQNWEGGMDVD